MRKPLALLGDSNPCFRRERDAKASLRVHERFEISQKPR
jgi:hypothetical protein